MERKVNEYLRDFPILQTKMNGRPIVYLDNGATTAGDGHPRGR